MNASLLKNLRKGVVMIAVWIVGGGWWAPAFLYFKACGAPDSFVQVPYQEDVGFRTGAICSDGSRSSATGRGACSWHGGVAYWNTTVTRFRTVFDEDLAAANVSNWRVANGSVLILAIFVAIILLDARSRVSASNQVSSAPEVVAPRSSPSSETQDTGRGCPRCGSSLRLAYRRGQSEPYYRCSRFPVCWGRIY